jgi:adenine deaminase
MNRKPAFSVKQLLKVARGDEPAEILLTNLKLLNVFTGKVEETSIAIHQGRVVGFGDYKAHEVIDFSSAFVTPGFIDAHLHIESSMLTPYFFARAVLPKGTTTVIADPHEIANVLGKRGINYFIKAVKGLPLSVFFMVPSCVPATDFETAGAKISSDDIKKLLVHPSFLGLGEMMNFPGTIYGDREVIEKIFVAREKGVHIDGHAPDLRGKNLFAYRIAGVDTDHETLGAEEALEKVRAGFRIFIREGTAAKNLSDLLSAVNKDNWFMFSFCTDDRHPKELIEEGHVDYLIRKAISLGLDPITAYRMATISPALCFGLKDRGALFPGSRADFVVIDDLEEVSIREVWVSGKKVAQDGVPIFEIHKRIVPPASPMHIPKKINLKIKYRGGRIRIIGLVANQIVTEHLVEIPSIKDGLVVSDPERGILKIAVIERYGGERIGIGFVKGFSLKKGALASTVAHDSHNVIIVGVKDEDMLKCLDVLKKTKGGLVAVADGKVLAKMDLPVAGLMADREVHKVKRELEDLIDAAKSLGIKIHDPFMSLSFLALPVIPTLKITDHGLIDVEAFKPVDLFVK